MARNTKLKRFADADLQKSDNMPIRMRGETWNQLADYYEQQGYDSLEKMLLDLLDNTLSPLQEDGKKDDLIQNQARQLKEKDDTIVKLEAKIEENIVHSKDAANTIADLQATNADLKDRLEECRQDANQNATTANAAELKLEEVQQQLEQAQARIAAATPKEGEVCVNLPLDTVKILDYVADREGKRRKQPWTAAHVVRFFVWSRFVMGNLNGDLRSVDDRDLKKLGIKKTPLAKPTAAAEAEEPETPSTEIKI